jgi:hypothetical protein
MANQVASLKVGNPVTITASVFLEKYLMGKLFSLQQRRMKV